MKSFLKKYKEIYEGWKNDLFPTDEILKMAEERAKICASCPLNVNNHCSPSIEGIAEKDFEYQGEIRKKGQVYKGCGCPLSKKLKSETTKCPLGKW